MIWIQNVINFIEIKSKFNNNLQYFHSFFEKILLKEENDISIEYFSIDFHTLYVLHIFIQEFWYNLKVEWKEIIEL